MWKQLQKYIPKSWFDTLKNTQNVSNTEDENTITVNSTVKKISKTLCKDFYWHIINFSPHIPKSNSHWHKMFSEFPTIDFSFWKQIYKIPFNTTRETRIQALQCKIIHNTIACNQWLNRIKIKESETCSYCNQIDNVPHFFINFEQTKVFWKTWGLGGKRLTNFTIRQLDDIIERILFGIPGNTNTIIIINYCIIYAKHLFIRKR